MNTSNAITSRTHLGCRTLKAIKSFKRWHDRVTLSVDDGPSVRVRVRGRRRGPNMSLRHQLVVRLVD